MNHKNKTVITLAWAFLLTILASCSVQQRQNLIVDDTELVVGTCAGFPPFEELDSSGTIVGFDIDVAQKIAAILGKKLVIKDMSFDALTVSLRQSKIDMIIAALSITPTRCAEIAMVHYQGAPLTSLPLLFWGKIPAGVTTIADLENQPNKTVCVQTGTTQEEIISTYPYVDIKHLENIPDLILDIKHGKSIAAVIEPMVITALQKQIPEIKTLDLPLKQNEQDSGHGIGIKKENKTLVAAVEKAVTQLKRDGTIAKLEQKWFTTPRQENGK